VCFEIRILDLDGSTFAEPLRTPLATLAPKSDNVPAKVSAVYSTKKPTVGAPSAAPVATR